MNSEVEGKPREEDTKAMSCRARSCLEDLQSHDEKGLVGNHIGGLIAGGAKRGYEISQHDKNARYTLSFGDFSKITFYVDSVLTNDEEASVFWENADASRSKATLLRHGREALNAIHSSFNFNQVGETSLNPSVEDPSWSFRNVFIAEEEVENYGVLRARLILEALEQGAEVRVIWPSGSTVTFSRLFQEESPD